MERWAGTLLVRRLLVQRLPVRHYGVATEALMKIRYQNGSAIEGMTLVRTAHNMRVAVQGWDDVMELTNIRGTWVSNDCEPVAVEIGMTFEPVENYSDDNFICSQELASHLVNLLFSDSNEDWLDETGLLKTNSATGSRLLA
jgi:hypothetical protein